MSKPRAQSVAQPGESRRAHQERERQPQPPLSGSKQVKNANHSRQNHGEGS